MAGHWTEISAHRGGAEDAPLATWDAYLATVGTDADFLELDVRATADDVLVAHHDAHLTGVSGRPEVHAVTYRELCRLAGHRVPTVPDLMDLMSGRARAHLDLKEVGYESRVVRLARDLLGPDGFLVSSFEDESVRAVKHWFPTLPVALNLGRELSPFAVWRRARVRASELAPLGRIQRCGADQVSMHYRLAAAGVLARCAAAGFPVLVWTVNQERLIHRYLTDERVTVLVTDRPRYAADRRAQLTRTA